MLTVSNEKLEKFQERPEKGDLKIVQTPVITSRQEAALLQTGFSFYQQGRFVDAKSIFEGLAVLDENNAYVHGMLGSIYQKDCKDEAAIWSYSKAIGLFDKDVSSLVNRGELFLKLGRFQEAAEDFAKVIRLDPARTNPASNRARLVVAITQDALKPGKEKGIEAEQQRDRVRQTQGRR